jgi:hypothetical protein
MAVFTNAEGVTGGVLQLGVGGPILKNDAGSTKVFGSDGSTLASLTVDTLSGDVTQKSGTDIKTANGQGILLNDSDGTHSIKLQAPSTVTANVTLTFPNGAGTDGQVLKTNGSGVLAWVNQSGGGSPYWLEPVRAASTVGFTGTYNNGTSGVGATFTATANGALAMDGVSPTSAERVLLKNQATALQNGIYVVTTVGDGANPFVLTRATDMDTATEFAGRATFVQEGTVSAESAFVCTNDGSVTVGTTSIAFVKFAGAKVTFSQLEDAAVVTSAEGVVTNNASDTSLPTAKAVFDYTEGAVKGAGKVVTFKFQLGATNTIVGSGSKVLLTDLILPNPSVCWQVIADTTTAFDESVKLEVGIAQSNGTASTAGSADSTQFLGNEQVQAQSKKIITLFSGAAQARKLQVRLVNQSANTMDLGTISISVIFASIAESKADVPA